jgi:hypothetical protein
MDAAPQGRESMTELTPDPPAFKSHLSKKGVAMLNIEAIRDQAAGIFTRSAGLEFDPANEAIDRVFQRAREEFDKTLQALRTLTQRLLLVAGGATVLAVGGAVGVAFANMLAGGAVATGGLMGLLAVFKRIYHLGRDQAVLELLPMRYEMALAMASNDRDRQVVLKRFLDEMQALTGSK